MKNKTYVLNTILAFVVGLALLALVLLRTFCPVLILPKPGIPTLALLSLIALLADFYIAPGAKRCYICIPVFAAITFGLLPWVAGYAASAEIWKLALGGCVVFTASTWLFTSMTDRLSSGTAGKAAPVISAFCLYLASQCLNGIFL